MRGISLIEVLVSLLVFSIGMIGLATLSVLAVQANRGAMVRTQVSFLASGMIERMRTNPFGVWRGLYDRADYPTSEPSGRCDASQSCTPADVAQRDRGLWSDALRTHVPGVARTSIACDGDRAGYTLQANEVAKRPPYGGSCRMIVRWAEHGFADDDGHIEEDRLRSFTWMFQP
jgi:type IV pilus assembly protein PilV